jgi:hypothetical protein
MDIGGPKVNTHLLFDRKEVCYFDVEQHFDANFVDFLQN